MLGTILLVILVLFLLGALTPMGGGFSNYYGTGYYGSSLTGIIILVVIVLLVTGRL